MTILFEKYQGAGNDFVLIDDRDGKAAAFLGAHQIRAICDRRFGIGADGLMLLASDPESDFRMVYFNADGRESSMCGNGGRCIVDFAQKRGLFEQRCTFEAIDGRHEAIWTPVEVSLKMTRPKGYRIIEPLVEWIDTGSPHLLLWDQVSLEALSVDQVGGEWRRSPGFAPHGTNVNFIREDAPGTLAVRTFERGVEAETLSCGTGVTACAYVYLKKKERTQGRVEVRTPGGSLFVEVTALGSEEEAVWLIGPATFVFQGEITLPAQAKSC